MEIWAGGYKAAACPNLKKRADRTMKAGIKRGVERFMKSRIFLVLFCCVFLAGCFVPVTGTKASLKELLEEANASHPLVEKQAGITADYLRKFTDERTMDEYMEYFQYEAEEYRPDQEMTLEQAGEDITYLFDGLYNCYGAYEYFGGTERFETAKQTIFKAIEGRKTLTCEELQNILRENLKFIKDGHFSVNAQSTAPVEIPYFFREREFIKTDRGYQTLDGKTVESIEGYPDLTEILKRSISEKGEWIYYPVLLKSCDFASAVAELQFCDETLTVRYTNGETETLTAEPYQVYSPEDMYQGENTKSFAGSNRDIPVLRLDSFSSRYEAEVLDGADFIKNAPVAILDLRLNPGGAADLAYNWMKQYAGTRVPNNLETVHVFTGTELYGASDRWIGHENVLILLVGKYTASAAEALVDMAYNLENVLIVGENTRGALLGASQEIALPNSKIRVDVGGGTISLWPEETGYFEELRGFYPDIWVPAGEAEELAVRLIEQSNS